MSGSPRAMFLTQWFDPEPGTMHGLPLAKWLMQKGYRIKVLTGFPNYPTGRLYPGYRLRLWQREQMEGVPILRVPLYPSHDSSAFRRILNYSSFAVSAATIGASLVGSSDVGYVYHPPATIGFPAMVLKALRSIPFVYHIADMWPESVVESGMVSQGWCRQVVESLLSTWCRSVYRQAKAITVLSPGFKRLLLERGVSSEKVHVIYNWTEEHVFRPLPKDHDLGRSLGLSGRFNVMYAGNLGPFQGLETVVKAAVRLKEISTIQVVFVGTGQQESELKNLALQLKAGNILFLGRRQYWEMPKLYSLADVLLIHLKDLPFFSATVPGKTQVSLASGRPILMGVRGDAAELVRTAEAGLVCEPENDEEMAHAIVTMFRMDRDQLEAMGTRGRSFYLKTLSLETGGSRLDELFRQVLEETWCQRTVVNS